MTDALRNTKIAKIKVASKTLALEEESYRALLKRVTGKESCAAMTSSQLDLVLDEFKRLGFRAVSKRAGERKLADSGQASKIRALWLCLYQMGALTDSSETALAKFVKRSCGIDDMHWLTPRKADGAIRALRGWMVRLGYVFPTSDFIKALIEHRRNNSIEDGADADVIAAKLNLLHWQAGKLNVGKVDGQCLSVTALAILPSDVLDVLVEKLGRDIRAAG